MKRIKIGRDLDNNLVITNNMVSRHHCEIIQENNRIRIVDLNSRNGTFVNGKRIYGETYLNSNDNVTVCDVAIDWQGLLGVVRQPNTIASGASSRSSKDRSAAPIIIGSVLAIALVLLGVVLILGGLDSNSDSGSGSDSDYKHNSRANFRYNTDSDHSTYNDDNSSYDNYDDYYTSQKPTYDTRSSSANDGYPTSDRVANDLLGVEFSETSPDGFFSGHTREFLNTDQLRVRIDDTEQTSNSLTHYVTIYLTTATYGQYILSGRIVYINNNGKWTFDMFVCDSIMPQITGNYNDCVTIQHKGNKGERYLELTNHSNVKLGVYLILYDAYSQKTVKGMIAVGPNETVRKGGLFVADIETYTLCYIERF